MGHSEEISRRHYNHPQYLKNIEAMTSDLHDTGRLLRTYRSERVGRGPQTVAVPLVILMKHNGHWLRELSDHWRAVRLLAGTEQGSLKSTPLSKGRRASSVAGFAPDVPYVSLWWNFYLCTAIHGSSKKNTHIQKTGKARKKTRLNLDSFLCTPREFCVVVA